MDCNSIFECFFGLNSEDVRVYFALLQGIERIEELGSALGKKESSIYKSLQKLLIAGLAYREKKTIPGGGYYFIYRAVPKEVVAKEIENLLDEFYEKVKKLLGDLLADRSSGL
ncbi:MAG: helix-turn-helix domain-containing protein [Archaeoglobaceae archaeon]|nr:helix-turn-helix domain-containing protein [Archaeoglobales archaeon]MDI9642783.1 helix-turn-helix domain-containing protein [Archaeoglobales archaeon]